jgi:hypothetical protein
MATTKKVNGGKRKNSGRYPIADKKIPLVLHVRESEVTTMGGLDSAKQFMYGAWEQFLGLPRGQDYKSQYLSNERTKKA